MLDMGFRPPVDRIVARCPAERQTLFFSATMPKEIAELANAMLRNPVRVAVTPSASTVERVEQRIIHVDRAAKPALLAEVLRAEPIERVLIFTRTKHGADKVVRFLVKAGLEAAAIHGNKSQSQRERVLEAFRTGDVRTLVATDIAARGIDVDGVSHVINYELPHEPESYVHRIGRTGRAGRTGIGITFVEAEQVKDVGKIAASLRLHAEWERSGLAAPRPHVTSSEGPRRRHRPRRGRRPSNR